MQRIFWKSETFLPQSSGSSSSDHYRKNLKNSDTRKNCCNYPKIGTALFYYWVMDPNDADGMANSVEGQCDLGLHCLPRPVCLKTLDHYGIFRALFLMYYSEPLEGLHKAMSKLRTLLPGTVKSGQSVSQEDVTSSRKWGVTQILFGQFSSFFHKNIRLSCGYSLESTLQGNANEYSQYILKALKTPQPLS